jgi:hypothetical protein
MIEQPEGKRIQAHTSTALILDLGEVRGRVKQAENTEDVP